MATLDDTDKKILELLQNNAKLTIREIAAQLHLSTTPIFDRIKRLEVMECYHISGDADYMIKVVVGDMDEYNDFLLSKMSKVPNIYRHKTQFALSCTKYSTAFKNI